MASVKEIHLQSVYNPIMQCMWDYVDLSTILINMLNSKNKNKTGKGELTILCQNNFWVKRVELNLRTPDRISYSEKPGKNAASN